MKLRIKIISTAIFLLALLFVCLHIFVNVKGKSLVITKLQQTLGRKTRIDSLTTSFPATIHIKNIEVEGMFSVEEIIAGAGLFDVFRNSFRLSTLKIIRPVFSLEKGRAHPAPETSNVTSGFQANSALQNGTNNKSAAANLNSMLMDTENFFLSRIYINHFIVRDGTFNFLDKSIGADGLSIKIKDLNVKVDNLNFTNKGSRIIYFDLKGKVPWGNTEEEGSIEADGWLNFFRKDMQAELKITDIDGIYLYPYYANWVDLEKARIEKAKLNFTSSISGLNNNVSAECHLELTDIVRRPRTPEESTDKAKAEKIADAVLGMFRTLNQGKIALDFTVKTTMDRPEFGFGSIKMAFENKLAQGRRASGLQAEDILKMPGNILEGTFKGAADLTKAVFEGVISVGNEAKRTVGDVFRKNNQN